MPHVYEVEMEYMEYMKSQSVSLSIAVHALVTALFAKGILAQMAALSFQFTASRLSAMFQCIVAVGGAGAP